MSRPTWIKRVIFIGFPRVSGDEPHMGGMALTMSPFSLLTRG